MLILAMLHGKWETEVEGSAAWAAKLPCWTFSNKITDIIMGNKPITGYHCWMVIVFLFIFHSPFLFIGWNLSNEFLTLGLFSWYWIFEDISWFIENRFYGLHNLKKGRTYWHKRWFVGLPLSYWLLGGIGSVFLLMSRLLTH